MLFCKLVTRLFYAQSHFEDMIYHFNIAKVISVALIMAMV